MTWPKQTSVHCWSPFRICVITSGGRSQRLTLSQQEHKLTVAVLSRDRCIIKQWITCVLGSFSFVFCVFYSFGCTRKVHKVHTRGSRSPPVKKLLIRLKHLFCSPSVSAAPYIHETQLHNACLVANLAHLKHSEQLFTLISDQSEREGLLKKQELKQNFQREDDSKSCPIVQF